MSDSNAALARNTPTPHDEYINPVDSTHLRSYHTFQNTTVNASEFVTATTAALPNELTTSRSGGERNSLPLNIVESAAKTEDEKGQEFVPTCSIRLSLGN